MGVGTYRKGSNCIREVSPGSTFEVDNLELEFFVAVPFVEIYITYDVYRFCAAHVIDMASQSETYSWDLFFVYDCVEFDVVIGATYCFCQGWFYVSDFNNWSVVADAEWFEFVYIFYQRVFNHASLQFTIDINVWPKVLILEFFFCKFLYNFFEF